MKRKRKQIWMMTMQTFTRSCKEKSNKHKNKKQMKTKEESKSMKRPCYDGVSNCIM